jgi:hypothetical protein
LTQEDDSERWNTVANGTSEDDTDTDENPGSSSSNTTENVTAAGDDENPGSSSSNVTAAGATKTISIYLCVRTEQAPDLTEQASGNGGDFDPADVASLS